MKSLLVIVLAVFVGVLFVSSTVLAGPYIAVSPVDKDEGLTKGKGPSMELTPPLIAVSPIKTLKVDPKAKGPSLEPKAQPTIAVSPVF